MFWLLSLPLCYIGFLIYLIGPWLLVQIHALKLLCVWDSTRCSPGPFSLPSLHLCQWRWVLMSFLVHLPDRLCTIVHCLTWIFSNYLVQNANKTETIIIVPPKTSQGLTSFYLTTKLKSVVYIGSLLVSDSPVNFCSCSCFLRLRDIYKLWHMVFLT